MRTTEIEGGGKNPKWDEVFQITVKDLEEELTLCVYDEDVLSRDHIGSTSLKVSNLDNVDDWFAIHF